MAKPVLNLKKFSAALKKGQVELGEIHLKFQKRIALEALTRIIKRTPVDTGRARANWQLASSTNESEVGGTDPGGSATIAGGLSAIDRITVPFGVIWIFNNVEYITLLEEGSSSQAPQGMVALSLREIASGLAALGIESGLSFTVE